MLDHATETVVAPASQLSCSSLSRSLPVHPCATPCVHRSQRVYRVHQETQVTDQSKPNPNKENKPANLESSRPHTMLSARTPAGRAVCQSYLSRRPRNHWGTRAAPIPLESTIHPYTHPGNMCNTHVVMLCVVRTCPQTLPERHDRDQIPYDRLRSFRRKGHVESRRSRTPCLEGH